MTSTEFAEARQRLGWSLVDAAVEYKVMPKVIEAYECGALRVPDAIARDIRFRSVKELQLQVVESSGLPACPLHTRLVRAVVGKRGDARDAALDAFLAHLNSCTLCEQRRAYAELHGPDMPDFPWPTSIRIVHRVEAILEDLPYIIRANDDEAEDGRRLGLLLASVFSAVALAIALLSTANCLAHHGLAAQSWRHLTALGFIIPANLVVFCLAGWLWDALEPIRDRFVGYTLRWVLAAVTLYEAIRLLMALVMFSVESSPESLGFLGFAGFLLLLCGPILGYQVGVNEMMPRRWRVMLWSALGGAVGAALILVLLLLAKLAWTGMPGYLPRPSLAYIGSYALFGLVLGFAGLVPRAAATPRLVMTGVALVGLIAVIGIAV